MSKKDKEDEEKSVPKLPILILALFLGTIVLGNQKAPRSHSEK